MESGMAGATGLHATSQGLHATSQGLHATSQEKRCIRMKTYLAPFRVLLACARAPRNAHERSS